MAQRLFTVQIKHSDGTNVYVATTEELAWAVVHRWVKRNWEDAGVDEILGDIPKDQGMAIKLYFDITDDQSFEVEEHIVIDGPETLKEAL